MNCFKIYTEEELRIKNETTTIKNQFKKNYSTSITFERTIDNQFHPTVINNFKDKYDIDIVEKDIDNQKIIAYTFTTKNKRHLLKLNNIDRIYDVKKM